MELTLTGDPLDAETAHRFGLVNRLTEPGGALDGALELAAQISANAPLALVTSKRIVRQSLDWTEDEGWAEQAKLLPPVFASADAREGASAFAERRPPIWTGE
jgi:enoyl-CoA hydratase